MTVAKEPESPESIHAVGIEMKVGVTTPIRSILDWAIRSRSKGSL